jgi:hypothetical protein
MSLPHNHNQPDKLSQNMQDEVIKIAEKRLGKRLSDILTAKVRQTKWSYMGLEMIIDTVKSIEVGEIENYLTKLD